MTHGFIAVVLLAVTPLAVWGQACLGSPTADGQYAAAGSIGLTDGAESYGAEVTANLVGPLSLGAGYSLIDIDAVETKGNSFGAGAAAELTFPAASLCPTARIIYSRFHEEVFGIVGTVTQIVVPVGFGVGKTLAAGPRSYVTLFGQPQFLWIRTEGDLSLGGGTLSESETDNEFGVDLGMRFSNASFYAGAAVRLTTIEDSNPVYTMLLGVLVGRKRG